MPTEPQTPTLAEVVRRAAELCDPSGANDAVAELVTLFEDRDEPITAVADVGMQLEEARRRVDLEGDDPAVEMTAAVTVYLAHGRDEVGDDRDDVLRLAARAEFDGDPPDRIADWLTAEGVTI